jgi:hypothetical protein
VAATFGFAQVSGPFPGQRQILGSYGLLTSWKSVDALGLLVPDTQIVGPGQYSYELWFQVNFQGNFSSISDIRVFLADEVPDGFSIMFNGQQVAYQTPVNTESVLATAALTLGDPGPTGANVSIGGNLAGVLNAPGYSDFMVFQIQVPASFAPQPYITPPNIGFAYQET